tara:strand:+ start:100 stop:669 length:570 start_codon:yes stop_codon:yes gene_type:complete
MIKIGILGDIGSGKSYIAKNFGHPVFNADEEVGKLYKKNKRIFIKLKKVLPKFIYSFPINKNEIISAIFAKKINLKKITKVIHSEIRKEMNKFLKKHVNKKIVILDIPLLLENKINKKDDILVFVKSSKKETLKRLKKRPGFNHRLFIKFKKMQLPLDYKMKKSHFIIKNNFTKKSVKKDIKFILNRIL